MAPSNEGFADELRDAWAMLDSHLERVRTDRKLARLALDLAIADPSHPRAAEVLGTVAESWPGEADMVQLACTELIALAEQRGMDAPLLHENGPEQRAACAALACLNALPAADKTDPEIAGYLWVARGNALRWCGPSEDAAAQDAFAQALALDDDRGWWWFDLALLHKWRGRYQDGVDANLRARARLGDEKPVLWNLAICATALGNGSLAGAQWKALGINASVDPNSGMPFVADLPPRFVRLPSRGDGHVHGALPERAVAFELANVASLSPCHGVLQSPTFRDAPADYGDVLLFDGAPVGQCVTDEGPQPVFAVLEVLHPGREHRWPFIALVKGDAEAEIVMREIGTQLPEGCRVFLEREQVVPHCSACAGSGGQHDHPTPPSGLLRGKLIVGAQVSLPELANRWEATQDALSVRAALPRLYEVLNATKRAGEEHQRWRNIERLAETRQSPA